MSKAPLSSSLFMFTIRKNRSSVRRVRAGKKIKFKIINYKAYIYTVSLKWSKKIYKKCLHSLECTEVYV